MEYYIFHQNFYSVFLSSPGTRLRSLEDIAYEISRNEVSNFVIEVTKPEYALLRRKILSYTLIDSLTVSTS